MSRERHVKGDREVYEDWSPTFQSGTFIGYGDAVNVFPTLAQYEAFLTANETFRQQAVVVSQEANQNLRDQLGELLSGAAQNPNELEFLVILEDGTQAFFGNRGTAQDWAHAQNKTYALCEIRKVQLVELSEAEVAARVAAL